MSKKTSSLVLNRFLFQHEFIFGVILLFFAVSCKQDDEVPDPSISAVPFIELKSVAPDTVHHLQDSLLFIVGYTDGDGDLGDYDPDTLSLWVTDNRFPL